MEYKHAAEILIIADDVAIQSLYSAILESKGYLSYQCTYTILKSTLDFVPRLVILHFDDQFRSSILEFLKKIRQAHDETNRPLILVIVSKDGFDQSLKTLVDACLISPVDPDHFLEAVEDLLQKGSIIRQ